MALRLLDNADGFPEEGATQMERDLTKKGYVYRGEFDLSSAEGDAALGQVLAAARERMGADARHCLLGGTPIKELWILENSPDQS
jgi:hypothetical protein